MEILKETQQSKSLLFHGNVQERDTACCLREDQAGCVQTQKSECKGAEGHNPPRTETLARHHKWVSSEFLTSRPVLSSQLGVKLL